MKKYNLIDAHTHKKSSFRSILSLELNHTDQIIDQLFCIGIHPWSVNNFSSIEAKNVLETHISNEYFCALGEMGLDKSKPLWEEQLKVFKWQLDFAKNHQIKNIIIHCVKAHNEVYKTLKEFNFDFKILWHDFNAGVEVIRQLSNLNSYFSLGPTFLKTNSKVNKSILEIPKEKLLLETDCLESDKLIYIYSKASSLLEIPNDYLVKQINYNFDQFILKSDNT